MDNYVLSTTEDIILVTITKIPSDSGLFAEIINLLCFYDITLDIISSPPVFGKGECITFTVPGNKIDTLLKISSELKKFYSGIAFSINCTNVKFSVNNISSDFTQMFFSKILIRLKQQCIPLRFVSCSRNEFLIITDSFYSERVKGIINDVI